jgi:hypothetical protein
MLFEEDREFNQGPFAEALRDQYVDERNAWLEDLRDALHARVVAADPTKCDLDVSSLDMLQLTAADFKQAIMEFDGGKTEKEIDRCVRGSGRPGARARADSWLVGAAGT